MAGYDDRDGLIWMDGELVNWRDAKVHILTHAMHYASSVFEGGTRLQWQDLQKPRAFRTPDCVSRGAGYADALLGG